jgi:hypothetical protein
MVALDNRERELLFVEAVKEPSKRGSTSRGS